MKKLFDIFQEMYLMENVMLYLWYRRMLLFPDLKTQLKSKKKKRGNDHHSPLISTYFHLYIRRETFFAPQTGSQLVTVDQNLYPFA